VAIVGHNGSGKSTLARHINGLLEPTSGKILVNGLDTTDAEAVWRIRNQVGMVFQNPDNQIIASVVEEDVAFGPENTGVEATEIQRRVKDSLASVGMAEFAKKSPMQLSGGQKQRVAIAGILAMQSDCIVADEPTAMLDPIGRSEVLQTLHRLNIENGVTIVLITHHMEEIVGADRVIVLDGGSIAIEDTPAAVFAKQERLAELGLDAPQIVQLIWELRAGGIDIGPEVLTTDSLVDALCQ
jgi:energy-coupling factor transport system ATP-binding protein